MLLTSAGACEFLSCSESTLYRLLRNGEIKGIKLGSHWRIREETLKRWAREQEQRHKDSMSQQDF